MGVPKRQMFKLDPFPLEKSLRIGIVKYQLHRLSREELEDFLMESLSLTTKLAHQVAQLKEYVQGLEDTGG
jgi:hypothetical protein